MSGFMSSHSTMSSLSRLRHSITTNQYIIGGIALFGAVFIYDYSSWRSYGGTPPSLLGYLQIQRWSLSLLTRRTLTDPSPLASSGPLYLKSRKITQRKGGRPKLTRWILPQRQHPESISQSAETNLYGLMEEYANTPPYAGYLETRPSRAEPGGNCPAIYVKPDIRTINPGAKSVFYEIAHVHPQDNSLHVYLSPQDAKVVLTREWGQRFPVEGMAPPSWIMVYAPRNEEEVEVVREIVRAAVCFAVGRNVQALSGSFQ